MGILKPERVLAIKVADFGDALLTTPALAAVHTAWPEARIDVLTTPGPAGTVFRRSGLVDEVLVLEKSPLRHPAASAGPGRHILDFARSLRAERYDVVLLFHSLVTRRGALKHAALVLATGAAVRAGLLHPERARSAFLTHGAVDRGYAGWHVLQANLAVVQALGLPAPERSPFFPVSSAARNAADALLADLPAGGRIIAIHPGGGPYSLARRWPAERFARLADALIARGLRVVLVGTAADDTAAVRQLVAGPLLDLTDRTDLDVLAAVLQRCEVLVANDGGVMHLAAAVGTPVVAVFGPTSPVAWGPWPPERHRVVRLDLPCQPCLYVGHRLGDPRGCPTRDCLAWLGPGPVLAAVHDILGS